MRKPSLTAVPALPALGIALALAAAGCQQRDRDAPVTPRAAMPSANLDGMPRTDGADGPSQPDDSKPAGQLADTGVTARVKTALMADDKVKGLGIHVETHDAAVTLTGTLETDDQVVHAVEVARGVTGVREVVNRLSVKGEDKAQRPSQG